jgi:hypothetical protein
MVIYGKRTEEKETNEKQEVRIKDFGNHKA